MSVSPVFVVDGLRTPFLKATGVPNALKASDLALGVARPLLSRQKFEASLLDDLIMGCVMPEASEANLARILALRLGLEGLPAWTVQRNCASGLQALDCAWQKIALGQADLILAGGTEAMSRAPVLWRPEAVAWMAQLTKARTWAEKFKVLSRGSWRSWKPMLGLLKGLTDPVVGLSMGQTAEHLAGKFGISREEADEYAYRSHRRVLEGIELGVIEPLPIYDRTGKRYEKDEGIRPDVTLEKLARLKPVFEPPFGLVTAGNSSQVSDGAACLILASAAAVKKHQLPVLGKISRVAWAALAPEDMGLGPILAIRNLMQLEKQTWSQIDYLEINEAFAAQVLACVRQLREEVDPDWLKERLNVYGGAIAVGHPVSASGARLVLELLHILKHHQVRKGIASLCIGGGQGGAVLLERLEK